MDAELDQLIRDTILRTAKRFPQGLAVTTLRVCLSAAMITLSEMEMEQHIRYLESCGFLELQGKRTPQFRLYHITADGMDELSRRGM